jgi:hypothetical protein
MPAEHFGRLAGYWLDLDANLRAFACRRDSLVVALDRRHRAEELELRRERRGESLGSAQKAAHSEMIIRDLGSLKCVFKAVSSAHNAKISTFH